MPLEIPWVIVAVGFALADIKVVEVHFRRESHAFSLTEVPAIIGLFFLSPPLYLMALLGGAGAALLLLRQAPLKVAFNLANYAALAVVMMVIFRAVPPSAGIPGLSSTSRRSQPPV